MVLGDLFSSAVDILSEPKVFIPLIIIVVAIVGVFLLTGPSLEFPIPEGVDPQTFCNIKGRELGTPLFFSAQTNSCLPITSANVAPVPASVQDPEAYCQERNGVYSSVLNGCIPTEEIGPEENKDAVCAARGQELGLPLIFNPEINDCDLTNQFKNDICIQRGLVYDSLTNNCVPSDQPPSDCTVQQCPLGFACNAGTGLCFPSSGIGASCLTSLHCAENLSCTPQGQCAPAPECPSGFVLVDGVCLTFTGDIELPPDGGDGFEGFFSGEGLIPTLLTGGVELFENISEGTINFSNDWFNPFNPDTFNPLINLGQDFFSGAIDFAELVTGLPATLIDTISNLAGDTLDNLTGLVGGSFNFVSDLAGGAINDISGFIEGGVSLVSEFAGDAIGNISGFVGGGIGFVSNFVGDTIDNVTGVIDDLFNNYCAGGGFFGIGC